MKIHTDSGFTIEIQKNHGIVTELEGNPQIVEIPREVEGIPITELGAYLFSGKNCQVIRIPQGVKKSADTAFTTAESWKSCGFPVILQTLEVELSPVVMEYGNWRYK